MVLKGNGSNWARYDLHVHTASSFDYRYRAENSDELLVKAWKEQNIKAVAITDHFIIDADRIKKLRELVDGTLTIFPGVELRTDKGSTNIHVILIFDEMTDLNNLSQDFNSTMLRSKAKPPKDLRTNENIYWDYNDIIEFAKEKDAIISIHSGSKSNGIDQNINNSLPHKMAVKTEYADSVDIFEVSKMEDIKGYKEHVFSSIQKRPVIICSDNHDPREYNPRELLWIKSSPTFSGLKQAIIHSDQRVFVGEIPPKLNSVNNNPEKYISSVSIKKNSSAINSENWFNVDMKLNAGLTTVIGNKGSGKSALADLIGYIGNTENSDSFSFLSSERFAREDKNYNEDYSGKITWTDNEITAVDNFSLKKRNVGVPLVRYLPQRYIEDTCNNLGEKFQNEINKVIFSYVDDIDKGDARNLNELISQNQGVIKEDINETKNKISNLNERIIKLESKLSQRYKKEVENKKNYYTEELKRHEANKPKKIEKPNTNDSSNIQNLEFIERTNSSISENNELIKQIEGAIVIEKKCIYDLTNYKEQVIKIIEQLNMLSTLGDELNEKFNITPSIKLEVNTELTGIDLKIKKCEKKIIEHSKLISRDYNVVEYRLENTDEEMALDLAISVSLYQKNEILYSMVNRAKEMLGRPQRMYQRYLDDLKKWEMKKKEIVGDVNKIESLSYYTHEFQYISTILNEEIEILENERNEHVKTLYGLIVKKKEVLDEIYKPIEVKLDTILKNIRDKVVFKATITTDSDFVQNTLMYINQTVLSDFRGKVEGTEYIHSLIRKYDFSSFDGLIGFVDKILSSATEDEDRVELLIKKRLEFYNHITCLDYLNVGFSLRMGEKELEQLSPWYYVKKMDNLNVEFQINFS